MIGAIYRYSPGLDEQRNVLRTVWQLACNQNISLEQRLHMAVLPCTVYRDNFEERVEALRFLLTLLPYETVKEYLAERWQWMPLEQMVRSDRREHVLSQGTFLVVNKKFIYELVGQDVLPTKVRNTMYELLHDMVPLVDVR